MFDFYSKLGYNDIATYHKYLHHKGTYYALQCELSISLCEKYDMSQYREPHEIGMSFSKEGGIFLYIGENVMTFIDALISLFEFRRGNTELFFENHTQMRGGRKTSDLRNLI